MDNLFWRDALVSMGIYIFEPEILQFIQPGQKLDFPDLVQCLLQAQVKVALYPSEDFWLDIGRPDDYHKAIEVFAQQPEMFLGDHPWSGTFAQE